MKRAHIYLKDAIFRICPYDKIAGELWSKSNFIIFLEETCSADTLGQKVLEALERPPIIIPYPKLRSEWAQNTKIWYKAMKIKSWKSFITGAKELGIEMVDNRIKIRIDKPTLPKGSYIELKDKARFCLPDDPKFLGQSIIDAFADCE